MNSMLLVVASALALSLFVTPVAVKAQVVVLSPDELPELTIRATLRVVSIGNSSQVSSSEDTHQYELEKPYLSLWVVPGCATISDGNSQEWQIFPWGPFVVTVDGHASVELGSAEITSGMAMIVDLPVYPLNFIIRLGDGDSHVRFDVVDWAPVPEPAAMALFAGIPLLGFGLWRRRFR